MVGAIKRALFQDTDGCASGFTKCLLGRLPALCLSLFLGVQYAKRQSLTPCFSLTCLEKSSDGMQNSVAETQHKGTRSVSLPVQMNYVTHYLVYLW